MSAEQTFVVELAKLVVQVVLGVLTLAGLWLNYRKTQGVDKKATALAIGVAETAAKTDDLTTKTEQYAQEVNGKMTVLLREKDERAELTERAARAEGRLEAMKEVAPPTVLAVQVPPPPTGGAPGGRRAGDRVPDEPPAS